MSTDFEVIRLRDKWGIAVEGEVLALSASKRGAEDLARKAQKALASEPPSPQARVRGEPRSFRSD